MTTAQILALAVAAIAILGMVAVFAIAFRREVTGRPVPPLDRRTRRRDRSETVPVMARVGRAEEELVEEVEEREPPPPTAPEPEAVEAVEVRRVEEISPEEAGVTRRQFFNRALLAAFGSYMALLGLSMLAFFWPRLGVGFGADIDAGDVDDLRSRLEQPDGSVDANAAYIPEARAYVVPVRASLEGTPFEGLPVVAGGLAAIYQRCVHLGCRVPWCNPSQGFECPCHGSKYNLHGEYESGPAPRNLDRFVVEVNDASRLIIRTREIIETPRSQVKTVPYPRGPACIEIGAE